MTGFVPRKDALPGARHPVCAIIAMSCAVVLAGCVQSDRIVSLVDGKDGVDYVQQGSCIWRIDRNGRQTLVTVQRRECYPAKPTTGPVTGASSGRQPSVEEANQNTTPQGEES